VKDFWEVVVVVALVCALVVLAWPAVTWLLSGQP
jgi:hypothetical protein